ncbi:ABC transporter ATP-binding protein [Novosphingobium sp. 9U]|uniref:ABC transporter ATP-binding protein n=1 Tax=Novosphingobium sp. 9U TaxID=2653158 RepID=UPI0013573C61|nr:ABC transporter ATP-binding protein [Novosphingobium sp. 9U]
MTEFEMMAGEGAGILPMLKRLYLYVPSRRIGHGAGVLCLMVVGAFAELVAIGAVVPFLALIADPNFLARQHLLWRVLNRIGVASYSDAVVVLASVFCALAIISACLRIALAWASQKYVFCLGYDLGVALYERMLFQSYEWHTAKNSSMIISGVSKVQIVLNQSMLPALQCVTSLTVATFIMAGLIYIDPFIALVSFSLFGAIYVSVSYASRRRLKANSRIIAKTSTDRLKVIQEGLGGIRDVIIDEAQPVFLAKFSSLDSELRDAQATNALIAAVPRFVIEGAGMVIIALLALYLNRQPGGLTSALPVLGAIALGAQRLLPLLQQIYLGWTSMQGNSVLLHDVLQLLGRPLPVDREHSRNAPPLPFTKQIRFDQVAFRYASALPPVIDNLDLVIPKGSRVGLVGKTGSGKTTTVDLLMGLLMPTAGCVTIDGVPLNADNISRWYKQIAHVPQSIYLSDTTIVENIAFGVKRQSIDFERARRAAEHADIASFILQQPDGFDTVIGERGVRLSGGQRQRIGIARALYKQSSVLILDEATSALDDQTELSIMNSVARLGADITVIMIAHRTSTLRQCDLVVELRSGAIVRRGTYEEMFPETGQAVVVAARS